MYGYYQKPKHKVFISFYHQDDQWYKNYIDTYLSAGIINKSVQNGEYDPDNSDEYIKRLIREEKVSDSSVVVVLLGPNTKKRKHVDWEIYAGLRASVNGSSGLVGIILPEFSKTPDGICLYSDMPKRFADNVRTGYAKIYEWEYARTHFIEIVEAAFYNRISLKQRIDNSAPQMQRNL